MNHYGDAVLASCELPDDGLPPCCCSRISIGWSGVKEFLSSFDSFDALASGKGSLSLIAVALRFLGLKQFAGFSLTVYAALWRAVCNPLLRNGLSRIGICINWLGRTTSSSLL